MSVTLLCSDSICSKIIADDCTPFSRFSISSFFIYRAASLKAAFKERYKRLNFWLRFSFPFFFVSRFNSGRGQFRLLASLVHCSLPLVWYGVYIYVYIGVNDMFNWVFTIKIRFLWLFSGIVRVVSITLVVVVVYLVFHWLVYEIWFCQVTFWEES